MDKTPSNSEVISNKREDFKARSAHLAMLRKACLKESRVMEVKREAVLKEEDQFSEEGDDREEPRKAFQMERENIMQEMDAFKTERS
ncbi:unnamed protein product [Arctogadus glacialis]